MYALYSLIQLLYVFNSGHVLPFNGSTIGSLPVHVSLMIVNNPHIFLPDTISDALYPVELCFTSERE